MSSTAPPYHLSKTPSETSLRAPTLPPYSEHADADFKDGEDIELASLSPSTTSSSTAAAAAAATTTSSSSPSHPIFTPTKQLQIQTAGKSLLSLPTPQRPDPIPIFSITPDGHLDRPLYISIRPSQRSGSCFLVHGDDETQAAPLTTTTYRFGPGRAPVVVLGDPTRSPAISAAPAPESGTGTITGESETEAEAETRERRGRGRGKECSFEITSRTLFSRAVTFEVPGLGSFAWRHGTSAERASAHADSLLVCEILLPEKPSTSSTSSSTSTPSSQTPSQPQPQPQSHSSSLSAFLGLSSKNKNHETSPKLIPHRIAHLVRNATFRTPGTSRTAAGNGGRLVLDLALFEDEKARRERVEWLVVTTAITMLKREVDRRRARQIAAFAAN